MRLEMCYFYCFSAIRENQYNFRTFHIGKMIQTDLYSFSYKKGSLVPLCKRCGEQNFYRNGKNKEGIQRYKCKKCNMRFLWTSDLERRRFFSNIISFAVEIYTDLRKAVSLEGVAELLKKIFGVKVSDE